MSTPHGILTLAGGSTVRADLVDENIVRLRISPDGSFPVSTLHRYGFLSSLPGPGDGSVETDNGTLTAHTGALQLTLEADPFRLCLATGDGTVALGSAAAPAWHRGHGFRPGFAPGEGESVYGLGDSTRDRLNHRGNRYDMWVLNVASYIPVPFMMSPRGWGLFVNTTWKHSIDVGKSNPDVLEVHGAHGGMLDLYLFAGSGPVELLDHYTRLTGRPVLPPKFSFGMWYLMHTKGDAWKLVEDARRFRERHLPCDVVGVEPGWMENHYDLTVDKDWHPERFPIPPYSRKGSQTGRHTFIQALKRMGYRLENWMVCDWDLSWEAERRAERQPSSEVAEGTGEPTFHADDADMDTHFSQPVKMDKVTIPDEPFYKHLTRFVNDGVDFFKQDGGMGVCVHPDRLYGNGMTDLEMHNLYGLIYCQQMYEGFVEHTGGTRRPVCFTSYAWGGLQRYTGTWTGDTGGEARTLVACLNLGLSGHGTITCDMEVTNPEGIHYGFLMCWAQVNSWNYWREPWYLGERLYPVFETYSRLRARLVPYVYTAARRAEQTGLPVMRPLVLMHPDSSEAESVLNQFYLGDNLVVQAFDTSTWLPEGTWWDVWTGRTVEGGKRFDYRVPDGRGGGLFARAGTVLPLGPEADYVDQDVEDVLTLHAYPGAHGSYTLYEDDGTSFDYREGAFAETRFELTDDGTTVTVTAAPREGAFTGMTDDRRYEMVLHLEAPPAETTCCGNPVECTWDEATRTASRRLDTTVEKGFTFVATR